VQYIDIALPAKDAKTIANWYDALSKSYDELYGEEQEEKHEKVLEFLGNRGFKVIVDVGCGTGRLLGSVSQRGEICIGIDLSSQMLGRAKRRIIDTGIQLIRADASHLPLRDQIADGVSSVSMTEGGPFLREHFDELSRIASEDAILIMTIFDDKDRASSKQLDEMTLELVAELSGREQLYAINKAKHRVGVLPNPRL
jgi:ubiquinone/menaquinone biosynthesis C-methylase UbiE